uniref:E3 ubiquitin-protein ligase XIAP-like n=1 Tax=Styela clava TaxID=7725 RepID=UPI00193ADB2D|nr:E3 ubiquitin-protein ligase XIAP-like [Styela clava]
MPDEVLSQHRDENIADDGNTCNDPRAVNNDLPYINFGNPDREDDRLATFRDFPQHRDSALPRDLANAGFFFTGVGDVVKCFSCGNCVERMTRREDPRDRRFHRDDCLHRNDLDERNVPATYPPTALPLHNFLRNGGLSSSANTIQPTRERNEISEPMQQDEEIFVIPQQPSQPSCDVEPQDQAAEEQPADPEPQGAAVGASSSAPEEEIFPAFECSDPFHAHMADPRERLRTFQGNWQANIGATPQNIADAGFYYTNERDRVTCWYCNGGLENWERDDDPWIEHAKWFPHCEFLLRHKGPDFVGAIAEQFPDLPRPNNDPAHQPTVAVNPLPEPPPPPPENNPLAPPRPRPPADVGPRRVPGPRRNQINSTFINIVNGQIMGGMPPNVVYNNNPEGGFTINIHRHGAGGATRTVVRGTNNVRIVQTGGGGRRLGRRQQQRQAPEFVDPGQDAERHQQTVDNAMANSPLVTSARNMGFTDDVIRVVLLSKCRAGGGIYDNIEDFVEALTEYQTEAARLDENPAPPVDPPPEGAAGTSQSGEGEGASSSSESSFDN